MLRLPRGLRICDVCGGVRGRTLDDQLSVCLCQGVRCNWCGTVRRRPISDYYDPAEEIWVHVPWFGLMAHRCPAPPERRHGEHFTLLPGGRGVRGLFGDDDPDDAALDGLRARRRIVVMRCTPPTSRPGSDFEPGPDDFLARARTQRPRPLVAGPGRRSWRDRRPGDPLGSAAGRTRRADWSRRSRPTRDPGRTGPRRTDRGRRRLTTLGRPVSTVALLELGQHLEIGLGGREQVADLGDPVGHRPDRPALGGQRRVVELVPGDRRRDRARPEPAGRRTARPAS